MPPQRLAAFLYAGILALWANSLKQKPRWSRDGPFIRFVQAIANPVLGEHALRPEGIRSQLKRWRRAGGVEVQTASEPVTPETGQYPGD
jgi:hypothetical protein